jgi:hypothetical protein
MSIYYSAGTVSVSNGSATVTGVGTSWLTNGIRAGDILRVRNQSAVIATVNSATSITLDGPWVPATATGSAYSIARVDDGLRALQVASDLLATFQSGPANGRFSDGSAATPGVGFAAQTNTGLFRPATSVFALSVNGTERMRATTTGVNITGDLTVGNSVVFRRANVLGAVSHSGGVPTGAIIQRGSNANGEFVRFADGTQICTRTTTASGVTVAAGNVFRSDPVTWTFPAEFAALPTVGGGSLSSSGRWVALNALSTAATEILWIGSVSAAGSTGAYLQATGRWF